MFEVILPSLISAIGSSVQGYATAKYQDRLSRRQIAADTEELRKKRLMDIYGSTLDQKWAQYLDEKENVRLKRIRSAMVGGLRDMMLTSPSRTFSPSYFKQPTAPTTQQVASESRGIQAAMGV